MRIAHRVDMHDQVFLGDGAPVACKEQDEQSRYPGPALRPIFYRELKSRIFLTTLGRTLLIAGNQSLRLVASWL